MRTIVISLLFLVTCITVVIPAAAQEKNDSARATLSLRKFKQQLNKPDRIIVDVRTPEEFDSAHIPNALLINLKDENVAEQVNNLDKSKTYLLYCRSSKRSATALKVFEQNGFKNVYHLKGGFLAGKGETVTPTKTQ